MCGLLIIMYKYFIYIHVHAQTLFNIDSLSTCDEASQLCGKLNYQFSTAVHGIYTLYMYMYIHVVAYY